MRTCGSGGGHRRLMRAASGAAAMLVPAAFASAAGAATIAVNQPCFVDAGTQAAPMVVTGAGFVPGDEVQISSSDNSVSATATADATGAISVTTTAPTAIFQRPSAKTVTLTAQDFSVNSGTISAATPVTFTTLAVLPQPSQAKLTSKVTWYFSGFTPGKVIYGHYLRKKPVARATFGRAKGPCGLLKVRARFYPGGHPRSSSYTLVFDSAKRYSKKTRPRVLIKIHKIVL
jgi:hypothetical protein